MVSIFKKRNAEKELEETKVRQLKAYVSGNVIPIEEVSDPVFSQKALGGGVAIVPVENVITSPCDGVISAAMEDTKHAVCLLYTSRCV